MNRYILILFWLLAVFFGLGYTVASADTFTRLEVLRGRAAARVIVTDTSEPLVTEQRREKYGLCTRDVIITRRGDQELTRSYAAPNCRKISE